MPDATLGERACAYVVLRDSGQFDLATMREFFATRGVARFKCPERIEIVMKLPLTNVGKIKKTELRADIEQKLARETAAARPVL
jgi:non-ribosomal peptide synthetase component E (peptide arylation enzyme)